MQQTPIICFVPVTPISLEDRHCYQLKMLQLQTLVSLINGLFCIQHQVCLFGSFSYFNHFFFKKNIGLVFFLFYRKSNEKGMETWTCNLVWISKSTCQVSFFFGLWKVLNIIIKNRYRHEHHRPDRIFCVEPVHAIDIVRVCAEDGLFLFIDLIWFDLICWELNWVFDFWISIEYQNQLNININWISIEY